MLDSMLAIVYVAIFKQLFLNSSSVEINKILILSLGVGSNS